MLSTLINRPATVIQRSASGQKTRFGDSVRTESAVQTLCEIQQKRRDEPAQEGELSDSDWNLFFLPGTDLSSGDAVVVDGEEYELVGEPWVARNPRTGHVSHIECTARRTRGPDDEGGS